jgi:mono/diheme cytochrome c family protein
MEFKTTIHIFLIFVLSFTSCGPFTEKQGTLSSKIRHRQYYVNGKKLYIERCSNCHQKDGSGLVRLYPPINNADYFNEDPDRTICIIRNGLKGEIFVNGVSFNQPMPGNKDLTHLEIAELVTYLYGNWGEQEKFLKPDDVKKILEGCPSSLAD